MQLGKILHPQIRPAVKEKLKARCLTGQQFIKTQPFMTPRACMPQKGARTARQKIEKTRRV